MLFIWISNITFTYSFHYRNISQIQSKVKINAIKNTESGVISFIHFYNTDIYIACILVSTLGHARKYSSGKDSESDRNNMCIIKEIHRNITFRYRFPSVKVFVLWPCFSQLSTQFHQPSRSLGPWGQNMIWTWCLTTIWQHFLINHVCVLSDVGKIYRLEQVLSHIHIYTHMFPLIFLGDLKCLKR